MRTAVLGVSHPSESEIKVIVTQSCLTLRFHGLYTPWNSPGQNTGVSSLSLLQGIFPSQGSNPGLPQCRRILYQLSHNGHSHAKLASYFLNLSTLEHKRRSCSLYLHLLDSFQLLLSQELIFLTFTVKLHSNYLDHLK